MNSLPSFLEDIILIFHAQAKCMIQTRAQYIGIIVHITISSVMSIKVAANSFRLRYIMSFNISKILFQGYWVVFWTTTQERHINLFQSFILFCRWQEIIPRHHFFPGFLFECQPRIFGYFAPFLAGFCIFG